MSGCQKSCHVIIDFYCFISALALNSAKLKSFRSLYAFALSQSNLICSYIKGSAEDDYPNNYDYNDNYSQGKVALNANFYQAGFGHSTE